MGPPVAKAEPIRDGGDGGNSPGTAEFRREKSSTTATVERSENM